MYAPAAPFFQTLTLVKQSARSPFNPRAREGRDNFDPTTGAFQVLSIHAPARGATWCDASFWASQWLSIHAPARGATRGHCETSDPGISFNPRAREGRDLFRREFHGQMGLSIHAPARGATAPGQLYEISYPFQSTRPRGARLVLSLVIIGIVGFQSTRPRGARLSSRRRRRHLPPFNPRAREGRDDRINKEKPQTMLSIHAPARGATTAKTKEEAVKNFQSTRPRGARPTPSTCQSPAGDFQSTRPRGARPPRSPALCRRGYFQSTRPRGARLGAFADAHGRGCLSIHAPARGATRLRLVQMRSGLLSIHAPARGATANK